jgi:uncharacterized peroxidase-related enzyme
MTFLNPPASSPLYDGDLARLGRVPNYTKVFALAPDAYAAWRALASAVAAGLGRRRYVLATVVAAQRLGSRYCSLANAAVLRDEFYDDDTVRAILTEPERAGLDPADLAIVEYAARIAVDPNAATQADIDTLRAHGLSESEILHVALAVTVRRFFAGTLAAVGAQPDPELEAAAATLLPDHEPAADPVV